MVKKKKTLTVTRQRKLKKEFPDGEAVGRALVQFYLDEKRKKKEPDFEPALTVEEMNFLISTVKIFIDDDLFRPYSILEKVLRQFDYWIDHFQHIYYHGLFRDLSVIETPNYEIQIYHLLKQVPTDEEVVEKARERAIETLIPIVEILMPNWLGMMAYPLKELHRYSFRLKKIQEIMDFDFSPLLPDMDHHEIEVKELQRIARGFRRNLDNYINNNGFEVSDDVIQNLDTFLNINVEDLRLNDKEQEENTQKAIETVSIARRSVQ